MLVVPLARWNPAVLARSDDVKAEVRELSLLLSLRCSWYSVSSDGESAETPPRQTAKTECAVAVVVGSTLCLSCEVPVGTTCSDGAPAKQWVGARACQPWRLAPQCKIIG